MSDEHRSGEGDTREYPPGTGEYPADDGSGAGSPEEQPWWERAGFESLADAIAFEKATDDRVMGREPRDLRGLSLEEVLFSEPERPSRRRRSSRPRDRQVNVKLTGDEHSSLEQAARSYGVANATMARIFVVRGSRIALG